MMRSKTYWTVTLCFLTWGTLLYAQDKVLHWERTLLTTPTLTGTNPALLQSLTDSILFNAHIKYSFSKGNFVNYYKPNQNNSIETNTSSYNRINKQIVVFGLASYSYDKGKNSNGTSFLNPYRTPFNFTPKDNTTKGNNRIEQYNLIGALSYNILKKWNIGAKVDYKTISFVKFKDMRNINTILNLTANTGLSYELTSNNTLSLSYIYNRYIENMRAVEYGKLERDYFALVNKGSFMGLLQMYGDIGILNLGSSRPWVDIVHGLSVQYNKQFGEKAKSFLELTYKTGNGHYGNDSENSIVYMKHNKTAYFINTQLQIDRENNSHIIKVRGNYTNIKNYEQLYREATATAGNTIIEYYGTKELYHCQTTTIGMEYKLLWGGTAKNATWQLNTHYDFNLIDRKTSSYPYFRKQHIQWHTINMGIAKNFRYKNSYFWIRYALDFITGNRGMPIDGAYTHESGSMTTPDYLDNYLHHEREYLTAKRLGTSIALRVTKNYKKNNEIYAQLNTKYTQPFNTQYIKGNLFDIGITLGVTF